MGEIDWQALADAVGELDVQDEYWDELGEIAEDAALAARGEWGDAGNEIPW